jgi:hypothetical protein
MGGMGAGMICLEGTGTLSHFSLRNKPEVFNEPCTFAAVCVRGSTNTARVLEGPVPGWKLFGQPNAGNGAAGASFGLPRFRQATFRTRFQTEQVLPAPATNVQQRDHGSPCVPLNQLGDIATVMRIFDSRIAPHGPEPGQVCVEMTRLVHIQTVAERLRSGAPD